MIRRLLAALPALVAVACCPKQALAEAHERPKSAATAHAALVWIFGDDDAMNAPNESTPASPAANIGDRSGYDPLVSGYRSRYTGRENRVELRLGAEARDLVPALATAAELALGVDVTSLGEHSGGSRAEPVRTEDLGSFVELRLSLAPPRPCSPAPAPDTSSLALRLYPIDGDLERVGWLEALGWGGAVGPGRESPYATASGPVRAARLALAAVTWSGFFGFKTATFVEPVAGAPAVEETSYGFFGGVEARPSELVAIGVAGGYFEHGLLENTERGARAITAGGSARFSLQRGMTEPRAPLAFLGAGDDPFRPNGDARPGSFALGVELTALVQRLADFERPGATTLVPARGLAVFGGARLGRFETSAALLVRDPEFVMRNAPGVFARSSLPAAALRALERAVLFSNDVLVSEIVRLELATGLRFPAAVMTAALDRSGQPTGATLVVNGPGDVALLPVGTAPLPILDVRIGLEARLSTLVSAVGWSAYRRDYNRARPGGGLALAETGVRTFSDPDRFGYGVAARAVW
jgi:hypothetical protein